MELRDVLGGLVDSKDALSVGEDVVLLSSAKFDSDKIEVTKRVGLDLILPIAAVLPLENYVRWAQKKQVSKKVAAELMAGAGAIADAMGLVEGLAAVLVGNKNKMISGLGLLLSQFGPSLKSVAKVAGDKLKEADTEAQTNHSNLAATLTRFGEDLVKSEEDQILLRSIS